MAHFSAAGSKMAQETITKVKVTRHYGRADIYIGIGNVGISALFSISAIGKHYDYEPTMQLAQVG